MFPMSASPSLLVSHEPLSVLCYVFPLNRNDWRSHLRLNFTDLWITDLRCPKHERRSFLLFQVVCDDISSASLEVSIYPSLFMCFVSLGYILPYLSHHPFSIYSLWASFMCYRTITVAHVNTYIIENNGNHSSISNIAKSHETQVYVGFIIVLSYLRLPPHDFSLPYIDTYSRVTRLSLLEFCIFHIAELIFFSKQPCGRNGCLHETNLLTRRVDEVICDLANSSPPFQL